MLHYCLVLRLLSVGELISPPLHDGFFSVLFLKAGTKCLDKNRLFFVFKNVTSAVDALNMSDETFHYQKPLNFFVGFGFVPL